MLEKQQKVGNLRNMAGCIFSMRKSLVIQTSQVIDNEAIGSDTIRSPTPNDERLDNKKPLRFSAERLLKKIAQPKSLPAAAKHTQTGQCDQHHRAGLGDRHKADAGIVVHPVFLPARIRVDVL